MDPSASLLSRGLQPTRLGKRRAPALLSFPDGAASHSIVIVLPGGGVPYDKHWAANWLPLEDLPVLKAYVDLPLHGERLAPDLRERHRRDRVRGFFGPAILGMAEEIPSIIDDLQALSGNPAIEKVGLCGWSIGGLAAFLSALAETRVGAVAGFGIPGGGTRHLRLEEVPTDAEEMAVLEELDLLRQAGGLYPKPVLLMHGSADTWVSPESSRALHDRLRPVYAGSPDRLRYLEVPAAPHDPSTAGEAAREVIVRAVRDWLQTHLLGTPSGGEKR